MYFFSVSAACSICAGVEVTRAIDVAAGERLLAAQVDHLRALVHQPDRLLRLHGGEVLAARPQLEGEHGERHRDGEAREERVVLYVLEQAFHGGSLANSGGAHYSEPGRPSLDSLISMSRHLLIAVVLSLLAVSLGLPAATPDKQRTEADLKAVNARIERIRQQVQRDADAKNRLNRDLRAAERSVAEARGELTRLQQARAERSAERARAGRRARANAKPSASAPRKVSPRSCGRPTSWGATNRSSCC